MNTMSSQFLNLYVSSLGRGHANYIVPILLDVSMGQYHRFSIPWVLLLLFYFNRVIFILSYFDPLKLFTLHYINFFYLILILILCNLT